MVHPDSRDVPYVRILLFPDSYSCYVSISLLVIELKRVTHLIRYRAKQSQSQAKSLIDY